MKKGNVGIILILVVLISFICGSVGSYLILGTTDNGIPTVIRNNSIVLGEQSSIAEGVRTVYDSTVVVEGFKKGSLISTGTGFIYKKDNENAYIMTNHHVISGTETVRVILSDKTEIEATVKGSEAYSDIGVLAIAANKVKAVATIGDSKKLRVGDSLFTVGSPEGADYAGTVTKGILSGKDRLVAVALSNNNASDYYMKVLQTDAAINPGNSGGPICNINGEVIGITNMKLVDSKVEGIGFAIPIEDALFYAATLEKGENVSRPYFGIGMLDVGNSYYLWQNGIRIPSDVEEGIVILEVADHSPASEANLKKGDIIISLGGEKVSSIAEFRYVLYKHQSGEEVEVEYIRNSKLKSTKVKLTTQP